MCKSYYTSKRHIAVTAVKRVDRRMKEEQRKSYITVGHSYLLSMLYMHSYMCDRNFGKQFQITHEIRCISSLFKVFSENAHVYEFQDIS